MLDCMVGITSPHFTLWRRWNAAVAGTRWPKGCGIFAQRLPYPDLLSTVIS